MMILYKVFGSVECIWQGILYALIILTITIGNLFAIRQQNLKKISFAFFFYFASWLYYVGRYIEYRFRLNIAELLCIGLYLPILLLSE